MRVRRLISIIGLSVLLSSTYLPSAEAVEQPDRLTTRDRGSTSLDYHIQEIENVPHYLQKDYGEVGDGNCAIIQMTNLIMYWDQRYPQLVSTNDWKRVANRMSALTGYDPKIGVYDTQVRPTLNEYIKEHGLSNTLEVKEIVYPSYADAEGYVSQGYPVYLSMAGQYKYGDYYNRQSKGGHALTIKGIVRVG